MKVTDVVPKEKLLVFYEAAFKIIKEHLQEDAGVGATHSLLRNRDELDGKAKLVNTFCDGYQWGMSAAMALIEAGILNIQSLEIQKTNGGGEMRTDKTRRPQ